MMQTLKKSETVFKVLFLLMLVWLILGSVVYTPLKVSLTRATQQEMPPTLFGKMFVPYTVEGENPYSQIASGSLVFFEPPSQKEVQEGILVLYPTPDGGREQNVVFLRYSMGMVATMNITEEIGETYGIMIGNDPNLDLETIAASSVIGVGSSTMKQVAYLFHFATSTLGLLVLVLTPFTLFALFLLLFLRTRKKRKQLAEADATTPAEPPAAEVAPELLQNLAIDESLIQQETASLLTPVSQEIAESSPQEDASKELTDDSDDTQTEPLSSPLIQPDPLADAVTQPIEIAPLEYAASPATPADPLTHDLEQAASSQPLGLPLDLSPDRFVTQETKVIDLSLPKTDATPSEPPAAPPSLDLPTQEGDAMDLQQNFFEELKELNQSSPKSTSALDDEAFLAKIEEDLNRIEREAEAFDPSAAFALDTPPPAPTAEPALAPQPRSQGLPSGEDTIVFQVKEDEVDVKFDHIVSDAIKIDYHEDGSGFVIKTPKYHADITVAISEQ